MIGEFAAWSMLRLRIDRQFSLVRSVRSSVKEISSARAFPFFESGTSKLATLLVSYNNFARGRNKPQIACTDQQAVFTQLLTPARFAATHERAQQEIPEVAKAFMSALERILFLDPMPRRMRGYSFIVDKILKGDGSNISSTLYDLCVTQQKKDRVLAFIRDLPEQDITDIQFLEGPRKEVMVKLEETFGGTRHFRDAAVLSDGTLRVVAVAAALLSSSAGSTVVVEEIDNGVHPSRARTLLANIERVATEQKLAVLLTSHNPALLDALPVSAIPGVVFCYRDPEHSGNGEPYWAIGGWRTAPSSCRAVCRASEHRFGWPCPVATHALCRSHRVERLARAVSEPCCPAIMLG